MDPRLIEEFNAKQLNNKVKKPNVKENVRSTRTKIVKKN